MEINQKTGKTLKEAIIELYLNIKSQTKDEVRHK